MQGKWAEVDSIIEGGLSKFPSSDTDRDRLFLLSAQTMILRGRLKEARELIANSISSTISLYPASISSIYYLYEMVGDKNGAETFLSSVLRKLECSSGVVPASAMFASLSHIARLYRERGLCAAAASVYQTILSSCELNSPQRVVILAKLVETLSHTEEGPEKYVLRLPEVCLP